MIRKANERGLCSCTVGGAGAEQCPQVLIMFYDLSTGLPTHLCFPVSTSKSVWSGPQFHRVRLGFVRRGYTKQTLFSKENTILRLKVFGTAGDFPGTLSYLGIQIEAEQATIWNC